MFDVGRLAAQVKLNCNIADARFWGHHSICGLLMRMRDLYRQEHLLRPWDEIPKEGMAAWISGREALWKELEGEFLQPIGIDSSLFDPFEVDGINKALALHGLLYGAGYTLFGRPTFFLARQLDTKEIYDYRIYSAGVEISRDLSPSAAMLQGRCIFIRFDSLKALLWEKYQEMRSRRFKGALHHAFSTYGVDASMPFSEELFGKIDALATQIAGLFILHEVAEAYEDVDSDAWSELVHGISDRWTEFHLRGIKDILADTSVMGPLTSIIEKRDAALLSFYAALLDGIRRELFPEIMQAFQSFAESGDWLPVEEARVSGYQRAFGLRKRILGLGKNCAPDDLKAFLKNCLRDSALRDH